MIVLPSLAGPKISTYGASEPSTTSALNDESEMIMFLKKLSSNTKHSRKRTLLGSLAATGAAAALVLGGAAPALAWGSASGGSPTGCWGGFSGSSNLSGSQAYSSVSRVGSGCVLGPPEIEATVRHTSGFGLIVCTSASTYCSGYTNGASTVGGGHRWGSVSIYT